MAHELGHFFLHPMLKPELSNIEDWIQFQKNIDDESFGWFESQANEFAGRLLVPPDNLKKAISKDIVPLLTSIGHNHNIESDEVIDVAAEILHAKFGVCSRALAKRIHSERLWPPDLLI